MVFGKKKREIEHLKKLRTEHIEDSAYWFAQGDHKEYMKSVMKAMSVNGRIMELRKTKLRVFG